MKLRPYVPAPHRPTLSSHIDLGNPQTRLALWMGYLDEQIREGNK